MPVDNVDSNTEALVREVILSRRSSRTFVDKPIPKSDLLELVEAGIYAPSGSNSQNQRFLVIDDKPQIEKIGAMRHVLPYPERGKSKAKKKESHPYGIIGRAEALIIVFADTSLNEQNPRGEDFVWDSINVQNCAASIQNILLLATAKGIASCWISASEPMTRTRLLTGHSWHEVLEDFDIPWTYEIQGIIILGYNRWTEKGQYPKGERMHGVVWSEVERGPVDDYLVTARERAPDVTPGLASRTMVIAANLIIRVLLRVIRILDLAVARLRRPPR
jgi:nitroreductase